ncbi:MAG: hypothetical protein P9L89_05405 [Candidatus Celaenobacter polaris]|nr:hypothetical protein [Candidatus Celaenobacter polaris]
MKLITRPILIAIDNSILGKISKDYYSKNFVKQQKAVEFIENVKVQGYLPIFCFHHIGEILQHENENVVFERLSIIRKFPQVAWVKSVSQNLSVGSIIDIHGTEIQKISQSPDITLYELIDFVRSELVSYSTGSDFIEMIEPECYAIQQLNLLDIQKGKAVNSISHVRDPEPDKIKLSVLKTSRLKTQNEVSGSFEHLRNHYLSELEKRGDKKLRDREGAVLNFLQSVCECGKELYKQPRGSLYKNFLNAFGVDEKHVDENWTIGELGYFATFMKKLLVISRTFHLEEDAVLKLPLSKYPSWHIWVELDKCIRKEKNAHGSNIIDKYLASFSLYADILVVDKRVKEYFEQIIRREHRFSMLEGKIVKSSDYSKLFEN